MTSPEPESGNRRLILLGIAGVVVVAVGVAIGFGLGGDPEPESVASTTLPSTTQPSMQPSTSAVETTTTSVPTTSTTPSTLPASIGADLEFAAVADVTLDSESPDEASGGDDELVADTDSSDVERSLISFEVEGVPDDATISQATLRLFVIDGGGEPVLAGADGDWTEPDVTWDSAPVVVDVIADIPEVPDESYVRVNVTSVIEGNGRIDFYILNEADDSFVVSSKEGGFGPVLEVILGDGQAILTGAGDIASCDGDGDEATAALIDAVLAEEEDTLVFTLGDNAYEDGAPEDFADCYHPSWGRFKEITHPSAGARDYRTPGANGYFAYFGAAAGDADEGFYSYDYGGWHLVVLNSNCGEAGGCNEGSAQATWLEQDLSSNDAACTLAYWHHPAFDSTGDGVNSDVIPFWDMLYSDGAELVLNGDHHFYERFAPQNPSGAPDENGIVQFTVGTGGRSLAEIGSSAPNSEVRYNEAFGVLVLTLSPDGYGWEFRTAPDGSAVDSGSGSCH
jgi:hypothetical protein